MRISKRTKANAANVKEDAVTTPEAVTVLKTFKACKFDQTVNICMHLGVDPAQAPIPVLPAVHYTMGGILADATTASPLAGLFSVGECSSIGIHGANRLGSNSLTELLVFGKVAGTHAARFAANTPTGDAARLDVPAQAAAARALALLAPRGGGERLATLRREMAQSMEDGCGIYRSAAAMQATCDKLAELKRRCQCLHLDDRSRAWNTEWLLAIELGYQLDVAQAIAQAALQRKESRGSHQRLDGFAARDDAHYLMHSLAHYNGDAAPRIDWGAVKITTSPPGTRAYGAAGVEAERQAQAVASHG